MGPYSVISFVHFVVVGRLVLSIAIDGISISIAIGLIVEVDVSFFNPSREPCIDLAHDDIDQKCVICKGDGWALKVQLAMTL